MPSIPSKDGTPIAFGQSGSGPALLLIHGTGAAQARWKPVLPALEKSFTVAAMDRRGRGESRDTGPYSFEREFEDVAAVIDSLGGPVNVIAHSFGAICAVEAALLTRNIRKLILYEPPIPVPGHVIYTDEDVHKLEALTAADDREGVLAAFFLGYVRVPPREFAILRASPAWPARLAAAHTIARELRAHEKYRFDPARFRSLRTPTALFLGGASPDFFQAAVAVVAGALPDCRVVTLPDQQHVAMDTAPELFLQEAFAFLG